MTIAAHTNLLMFAIAICGAVVAFAGMIAEVVRLGRLGKSLRADGSPRSWRAWSAIWMRRAYRTGFLYVLLILSLDLMVRATLAVDPSFGKAVVQYADDAKGKYDAQTLPVGAVVAILSIASLAANVRGSKRRARAG